jgi:hypothetical protein
MTPEPWLEAEALVRGIYAMALVRGIYAITYGKTAE